MNIDNKELCLYAVQSQDGKWFRRKGYGGGGECWVEDFSQARIFPKTGGARSVLTWWANNYPSYGTPFLVTLYIGRIEKADETERIKKQNEKKAKAAAAYTLRLRECELKAAQKRADEAKKRVEIIKNAPVVAERKKLSRLAEISKMRHNYNGSNG